MRHYLHSLFLLMIFMTISAGLLAQTITVNGVVTSGDENEPLLSATVLSLKTQSGTITDFDGAYSIAVAATDTLQFSYIGYQTLLIPVAGQTRIDVVLLPDANLIEEVVVIGYGTVRKSDLTGAVASVKSEDLVKVPSANPVQALQGKVAGLSVLSADGDPGSTPVIRLRGITTLNNNNPIFVVDGVILDENNSLDFLNVNDIESIEVLKDASATAIFGSRGSNGVILVQTKRGKTEKVSINASIDRSYERVANRIGVMNGREFATYVNEINPGSFNNLDVLPDVDWQDLIFKENAPISSYNLSLSGASERVDYYFSLGYFGHEGVIPKSDLERITAKINTNYKVHANVTIGLNLSTALRDKENPPGVINAALWAWPINEPFDEKGAFLEVNGSGNPLASIEYQNSSTKGVESVGNLYGEWKFLKNFRFKSSYQFTLGLEKTKAFVPKFFVAPLQQNETSDLNLEYSNFSLTLWENTLNWYKEIRKHRIDAIVGFSAQVSNNERLKGFTENLIREEDSFWYLDAGEDDFERAENSAGRSTIASYLGRVNYVFDSRYLLTLTMRRDGSSKFGPNNRYANFPSAAIGWNISNESFFPEGSIFDVLKMRASWGLVGNEKINANAQYSLISSGNNAVFGENESLQPGAAFAGGGNPDLKWEETEQYDIGMNMELFNSRLVAELDYYVKTSNDILVNLEPAGYTGLGAFQTITYNVASVENSGFEYNLSYRNNFGDLSFQIGTLGSTVSNKVLNLGADIGADSIVVAGDLGNGQRVSRTVVGQPIGFFYGYQVVGVFQNQADLDSHPKLFGQTLGDFKYLDANNDGVLNSDDRVMIGSSVPDLIFGFNLELGYKGLRLAADIQGQMGNEIYNGKQAVRFAQLNYEDKFLNRWTGEGSTNEHPRASVGGINYQPSSYFVEDGSFVRLRSLTLSYAFPNTVLDKLRFSNLSVYIRGTNLFTSTDFTGYSPDLGASNALDGVIDKGTYPITRVMSVGLNLSL